CAVSGVVPGIHVLLFESSQKTWMAGTSPAMTRNGSFTRFGKLQRSGHFLDGDLVGIERQMAGEFSHRRERRLVGPDRILDCLAVCGDAEIVRIPLIGAVRHPLGARQ